MCVVSNVFVDQTQTWRPHTLPGSGTWYPSTPQPPTREEIQEFIKRLESAKAQDEAEGNADCGTEEKKRDLLAIINDLEVIFVELKADLDSLKETVEAL